MKGYKVTNVKREKKVGVAAGNLSELIEKSSKKLGVIVDGSEGDGVDTCRIFVAADGTAVEDDEYLATLPAQTVLVLLKPNEEMMSDSNFLYELIRSTNAEFITAGSEARDFLTTDIQGKFRVLQRYITSARDDQTDLSDRTQHASWFQGLDSSERTKEASMTKRAKERMRGYLYKTKSALQNSDIYVHSKNGTGKSLIEKFIADVRSYLEMNKFNGSYFNRKAAVDDRMCTDIGEFQCGGIWSSDRCAYNGEHAINPYRSREERIIFQTWNLDHQIELSRSIIPKIIEAVNSICQRSSKCEKCHKQVKEGFVAANKYYLQIFTRDNLKLVHIVCHHKGRHELHSALHILCDKCYKLQSQ